MLVFRRLFGDDLESAAFEHELRVLFSVTRNDRDTRAKGDHSHQGLLGTGLQSVFEMKPCELGVFLIQRE